MAEQILTIQQILETLDATKGKGYTASKIADVLTSFLESMRTFSEKTSQSSIRDLIMDEETSEKVIASFSKEFGILEETVKSYVSVLKEQLDEFSLWHVLGVTPSKSNQFIVSIERGVSTNTLFEKALRGAILKLEKWTATVPQEFGANIQPIMPDFSEGLANVIRDAFGAFTSPREEKDTVNDVFNRNDGVEITAVSPKALRALRGVLGIQSTPLTQTRQDKQFVGPTPENPSGGGLMDVLGALGADLGFGGIAKWLGGTLLTGAAGGLGIAGLFTDGPFKEIIKIAARIFGTLGKKIPGLGLLLGLGYGVSRMKTGDVVGGILEIASGLSSTIPGAGTALSFGIDALLAWRDLKSGGSGAIGKGTVGDPIQPIVDYVKKSALVKRFVGIGLGVQRIMKGEVVEGLRDVAVNGFYALNPIAWVVDFFNSEQGTQAVDFVATQTKSLFDIVGNWFNTSPTGKWLLRTKDNISKIYKGDVKDGITSLAGDFTQLAPIKWLLESLDIAPATVSVVADKTGNLFQNIYNALNNTPLFGYMFKLSAAVGDIIDGNFAKGFRVFADSVPGMSSLNYIIDLYDTAIPEQQRNQSKNQLGNALSNIHRALSTAMYGMMPDFFRAFFRLDNDGSISLKGTQEIVDTYFPKGSTQQKIATSAVASVQQGASDAVDTLKQSAVSIAKYLDNTWFKEGYQPRKFNDVIWRPSQAPISIHSEDTVLAAKKDGPIDTLLRGQQPTAAPVTDPAVLLEALQTSNNELLAELGDMMAVQIQAFSQMVANIGQSQGPQVSEPQPPQNKERIADFNTGPRDPAYLHKVRAWEYIIPSVRIT